MKRALVTLALIGAIAAAPHQARTQEKTNAQPKWVIEACLVVFVVGVGYVVIRGVIKLCRQWQTNMDAAIGDEHCPSLWLNPTNGLAPVRVQSSDLGSVWQDEVEIRMSQTPAGIVGVAYRGGLPVLTNTATMSNGVATLDFSSLRTGTGPASSFYRLAQ